MKAIAIHSRPFEDSKLPFVQQIFKEISKRNIPIVISEILKEYLDKINFKFNFEGTFRDFRELTNVEIMFSLGGDGTFLETVTLVRHLDIPILGINTGTLGFLATISPQNIKAALDTVFEGYYTVTERTLIQLDSNIDIFDGVNFAMNEFAVLKRDTASMIVVHTYIDGEYLNSYWADGLIIATPTGSTGYSLSVGGPVVVPHSNNFIISPISPHNLNVRPLIVPDKSIISLEIEGRSKNFLVALDSRSRKVDASIQLAVSKCDFKAKIVNLNDKSFLKTLRQKLNWGMDIRNYPKHQ